MVENLTIFLNTHSTCRELWPMFFGQLRKHWPDHPPVVMGVNEDAWLGPVISADVSEEDRRYTAEANVRYEVLRKSLDGVNVWRYDKIATFGQQYLQGLSHVTSDFVLPLLEDFILIGNVDVAAIQEAVKFRCPTRLIKTRVNQQSVGRDFEERWNLLMGDAMSMQATVWPAQQLLNEAVMRRRCKTPWEWETAPIEHFPCREPAKNGPKRGRAHWDSKMFNYVSTALCRGKWNLTE